MATTTSTGMNLPSIMHYLQTEFSRYERDRNFWELERAEMKARIAKLEGERKGNERMKDWYLRRLRMMEAALHEERIKTDPEAKKPPSEVPDGKPEKRSKRDRMESAEHDESYMEILRHSQEALKEQHGRTKARTYLEKCLTEVTYLVSANPTISSNRPSENGVAPIKADDAVLEADINSNGRILMAQNGIKSASPPNVPSRRHPSPAPILLQPDIESNGILEESVERLGHSSSTDTPLDEIALEEQEQIERIQHVYDKNGHFVDSVSTGLPSSVVSEVDEGTGHLASKNIESWNAGDIADQGRDEQTLDLTDMPFDYELEGTLRGHKKAVKVVRAFVTGKHMWIASAGSDSVVRIHRDHAEEPFINLRGHTGIITSLTWYQSTEGEVSLFSAGEDMVIRRWVLPSDASSDDISASSISSEPATTYVSHSQTIMAIAIVKNKLVSGSMDSSIRSWNIATGASQGVWRLSEHENQSVVTGLASCGDSTFVVSYTDGQVRHYDTENYKFCHALIPRKEHASMSQINSLLAKHRADGHHLVITAHEDMKIRLYDIKTRSLLRVIDAHASHISSLTFLPTTEALASTSHDRTVHVWSLETGARLGMIDALTADESTHGVASISAVAVPAGNGNGDNKDKDGRTGHGRSRHWLTSAGPDGLIRVYGLVL